MSDRLVSPKAAAEHYAVTRITIYRWIRDGKLSAVKIGGVVRVWLSDAAVAATAIPPPVPARDTKPRAAEKARQTEKAGRSEKRPPKQVRQRRRT